MPLPSKQVDCKCLREVDIALLQERMEVTQTTVQDHGVRLALYADSMAKVTTVVQADTQSKRNKAAIVIASISLAGTILVPVIAKLVGG